MHRELRPYQKKAVDLILNNRATALYMEMRLGKTLCVIRGLREANKVLVVAPMVGLWAWKRELALEGAAHRVSALVGSKSERFDELCRGRKWNLINYEGILACPVILQENWDAVVLDECRRISNPKAKTTKLLLQWSKHTQFIRKIILSGNPAPESPLEYFEQMRFLHGQFMRCSNYWQFRNYFFRELAPHEWVPKTHAVAQIKQEVHNNAYVLTRREAGLRDTKVYEVRTVKLGPEARRTYEKIRSDFLISWKGRDVKGTKWVPVQYLWLQQISSGFIGRSCVDRCKVREVLNLLEGELKNEQVIIWFRFNPGIEACALALKGIPFGTIKGDISIQDREVAIENFRSGATRVLLCQIKCAREAIDLSNSSTSIYFSNSHSLDDRVQSEDRILNPSKKEPLLYIDLVAEHTVDEDIVGMLRDKKVGARFYMTTLLQKLKEGSAREQNAMPEQSTA